MKREAIVLIVWMAGLTCAASAAEVARNISAEGGIRGGLIVHVGCGDGRLTAGLRTGNACVVHGLDVEPANVQAARKHILAGGHGGAVSAAVFDPVLFTRRMLNR